MSSKEQHHDHHGDEAEFQEFLLGRGGLASNLQALPQAAPSAELDLAILSKVEAALKAGKPAPMLAANDPRIPEHKQAIDGAGEAVKRNPPFQRQWRAPLATAASVAIVGFLGLQWRHQLKQDASVLPSVVLYEVPQQQQVSAALAQKAPPPPAAAAPAALAVPQVAATAPPVVAGNAAAPAPRLAAAKSKIAAPPTEAAVAAADTERAGAGPMADGGADSTAYSDPVSVPAALSQTTRVEIAGSRIASSPPMLASLAPSSVHPAPMPIAAPYAPIAAAPAAMAATQEFARRAPLADARALAPRQQDAPTASGNTQIKEANDWLALIEELLKAELRKDALDEWKKFRKAYPDYPVPDKVAQQLKALQQ
ncbi:hypothetical protein [Undibacterium sp.]|jgi:hypothetical protein|uniref:hypothetical protein n=1 Tax=Undibacterium sp. TaxID=1914977 RepID=UPI002CE1B4E6|nr:hypothetical protein [Undibacterium sp.]HTD03450.1 hypothetical protein [Undibacterium sp.]